MENILYAAGPFTSRRRQEGEGEEEGGAEARRRRVRTVFIGGLPPMTEAEAAKIMVAEARAVLRRDLGKLSISPENHCNLKKACYLECNS